MSKASTKSIKELRKFGLAFGAAMTILGSLLLWRQRSAGPYVLGLAATVLLLAVVAPRLLQPLEKVLATILRAVMAVVTYVVLVVAFFLVLTPMGLLLRLLGKDLLNMKFPTELPSYWEPVEEDGPATRPEQPY